MPIYNEKTNAILNNQLYSEVFERKGVKFLRIRKTKDLSSVRDVEIDLKAEHVWSYGDSLHKLSLKYYNSSENWWVIGMVNKKPTDSHFKIGDIVYIPRDPGVIRGGL